MKLPSISLGVNVRRVKGILSTVHQFLRYLRRHKRKIAYLQLTGRIEDYLVKELIYFAHRKKIFAITNIGKTDQQKIDICLLKGTIEEPKIYGMIEAKYLRNIHRAWLRASATDEIATSLKSLKKQLHPFRRTRHGGMDVKLFSRSCNIYGLVFASYVSAEKDDVGKKHFYDAILKKAASDFSFHDLSRPYFRPVYDDVKIKALDTVFYVTLKCGLWRRNHGEI